MDLPSELLYDVAEFCDRPTLHSLSLVSRRVRNATEPALYRTFKNPKQPSKTTEPSFYVLRNIRLASSVSPPDPQRSYFLPLLQRITRDPSFAHYIRHVRLQSWTVFLSKHHPHSKEPMISLGDLKTFLQCAKDAGIVGHNASWTPALLDPEAHRPKRPIHPTAAIMKSQNPISIAEFHEKSEIFEAGITDANSPSDREFLMSLRDGFEDPQVLLLLALLPRIQSLGITGKPQLSWERLNHVPHEFSTLECLQLDNSVTTLDPYCALISGVHLRRLGATARYQGRGWAGNVSLKTLTKPPMNLTALHLYCGLRRSSMELLLGRCRSLRTLVYVPNDDDSFSTNRDPLSPRIIVELLSSHSSSLRALKIASDPDRFGFYWRQNSQDPIQSLIHFENLESLAIIGTYIDITESQHVFERLPPKLRNMTLWPIMAPYRLKCYIKALLDGACPNLRIFKYLCIEKRARIEERFQTVDERDVQHLRERGVEVSKDDGVGRMGDIWELNEGSF
jgi:hypothetical protein